MHKQKNKALNKKYVEVLEKFGLLPDFDLSKKEKKVVKTLAKGGDMDLLALGDACAFKPEKTRKVCDKLLKKGAIVEEEDVIRLSPLALRYLHAKKKIGKSSKKFYRFMDTLTEKELDEFMKLVRSFEIQPEKFPGLEGLDLIKEVTEEAPKEEAPAEEIKLEETTAEETKEEEPKEAPLPEESKAPAKKPSPRRVSTRKKPAPKKEPEPTEEKKEGEGNE